MFEKVNEILDFWFQDKDEPVISSALWWGKSEHHDKVIRKCFGDIHLQAAMGKCDNWQHSPLSCLALIILLDQFSRVIYRNQADAYAFDQKALQICEQGIEHKLDKELHPIERQFFYMPLEHSEDIHHQHQMVRLMRQLVKIAQQDEPGYVDALQNGLQFALAHQDVIQNFGRFPHRNAALDRDNTQAELVYLRQNKGF